MKSVDTLNSYTLYNVKLNSVFEGQNALVIHSTFKNKLYRSVKWLNSRKNYRYFQCLSKNILSEELYLL